MLFSRVCYKKLYKDSMFMYMSVYYQCGARMYCIQPRGKQIPVGSVKKVQSDEKLQ